MKKYIEENFYLKFCSTNQFCKRQNHQNILFVQLLRQQLFALTKQIFCLVEEESSKKREKRERTVKSESLLQNIWEEMVGFNLGLKYFTVNLIVFPPLLVEMVIVLDTEVKLSTSLLEKKIF